MGSQTFLFSNMALPNPGAGIVYDGIELGEPGLELEMFFRGDEVGEIGPSVGEMVFDVVHDVEECLFVEGGVAREAAFFPDGLEGVV